MMKLQTNIEIPVSPWKIGYEDKILMMGSCFSDEIGEQMKQRYLHVVSNPFGTLYNPLSIAQALQMTEIPELVEYQGLWHSMAHHGAFSRASKEETMQIVRDSIDTMQKALAEASMVIVTFGTAWIYEWKGTIVGNCHKLPAEYFTRRRLGVEEIVAAWKPILEKYSDKHWLFTVSPIRHIKDGLHENQLSKATLLLAAEQLGNYFPSYEIVLDELRDYRFYADDLVHPSLMAVNYIWERFVETYCTPETQKELKEMYQFWQDCHHVLLHPNTPDAQAFSKRLEQRKQELIRKNRYENII